MTSVPSLSIDSHHSKLLKMGRNKRQQIEQYGAMGAMLGIGNAIPGLGEIQLGGMLLDYIDAYGYNNTLTRSAIDSVIGDNVSKLKDKEQATIDCLNGDQTKCVGIDPNFISRFNSYSSDTKTNYLKGIASWGTPVKPINKYYDTMLPCLVADNDSDMSKNCLDTDYKTSYLDYWNKNKDIYAAESAEEIAKTSIANMFDKDEQKQLKDPSLEEKKEMIGIGFISLLVVSFLCVYVVIGKIIGNTK